MASTSKMNLSDDDDEDLEDELEHFDDFTLASSWERFISEIEAVCRQWMADGPKNLLKKNAVQFESSKNLFKVKNELKDVTKHYCLDYYFETNNNDNIVDWNCPAHDLQLCFGVKDFLVIAPQSASGVVLDTPESSKLLSAVAIALSNCSCLLPAFVPVHDPSRKAYIGIQNMGTIFTRRFEADHIGSQVPIKLMHLEGLYELFVSKFAYSTMDFAVHLFKVLFTMMLTYRTLPDDEYSNDDGDDNGNDAVQVTDTDIPQAGGNHRNDSRNKTQWDDNCPWAEWYSAEDPIKGFELFAIWSEKMIESSLEMAELENYSPIEAERWMLRSIYSPNLSDGSQGSKVGFASQLSLLVDALNMSFKAQFMEDFVSVENPGSDHLKSLSVLPPPSVIDRVLKELFLEGLLLPKFTDCQNKTSRTIKGAALQSLFSQFCLHSLWFGNCNIRAIAKLWIEFVREVRWCWEELQPLPRMPADGPIDLTTCLINQKLQMLAICIERKRQTEDFHDCLGSKDDFSSQDESIGEDSVDMDVPDGNYDRESDSPSTPDGLADSRTISTTEPEDDVLSSDLKPEECLRKGSAGVAGDMKLLKSDQRMHIPFTQEPPLMTEDMHEERLQALEALGDSLDFSAQLEKEILSSDMSAFKAANPDAVFEDFIRWHSPGDWVIEGNESAKSLAENGRTPQGRLSQRMSDHGNMWRKIWNDAPTLPVSEQNPLLDPNKEGEKILHYLETVPPFQLLEQMICTSFRASADILYQTDFGGLKLMRTKLDQLYLTIASGLKSLHGKSLSTGDEIIEDLRRLCGIFEHVEKLVIIAASLHHKFMETPRLSEAIFSDYYNFYLPLMGTPSTTGKENFKKEFDKKQEVRINERAVVSGMFVPPTANQSWRKVLSMGNLLNGHEPIRREMIFSTRDGLVGNHYATTRAPESHQQEIETYRMYICGTSNDLRVALSVTSCD